MLNLFAKRPWIPLVMALIYGVSPIDAIPDAILPLGLVDDLGVSGLAVLLAVALWRRRGVESAPEDDPANP